MVENKIQASIRADYREVFLKKDSGRRVLTHLLSTLRLWGRIENEEDRHLHNFAQDLWSRVDFYRPDEPGDKLRMVETLSGVTRKEENECFDGSNYSETKSEPSIPQTELEAVKAALEAPDPLIAGTQTKEQVEKERAEQKAEEALFRTWVAKVNQRLKGMNRRQRVRAAIHLLMNGSLPPGCPK